MKDDTKTWERALIILVMLPVIIGETWEAWRSARKERNG